MRPLPSVTGTRCTRCTPASYFSRANTPLPAMSATTSLSPPRSLSLMRQHLAAPALQVGIALVHAEQVAGEQRRLVAAGAGADLEDGALLVVGVLGQQQEPDLTLQLGQPASQLAPLLLGQLAHLGIAAASCSSSRKLALRILVGLDRLDHWPEVGELLGELRVFARLSLGQQRLQLVPPGQNLAEAVVERGRHAQPPSRAASASWPSSSCSPLSRSRSLTMPRASSSRRARQPSGHRSGPPASFAAPAYP